PPQQQPHYQLLPDDHHGAGGHAVEPRGLRAAEPTADVRRIAASDGSLSSQHGLSFSGLEADRTPVDFVLAAFALAPGLAIGSFLNVVAARVPLRRSVIRPASACMACGVEIRWYDNVPLVSYVL